MGGKVDQPGLGHLGDHIGLGGLGSDPGFGLDELGDRFGFDLGSGESAQGLQGLACFEADLGHGGIADDKGLAGECGSGDRPGQDGLLGELEALDRRPGAEAVLFDQVATLIIQEGGEGHEEQVALGNDDHRGVGVRRQQAGDRLPEQLVECVEAGFALGGGGSRDCLGGDLCGSAPAPHPEVIAADFVEEVGEGLVGAELLAQIDGAEADRAVGGDDPDVDQPIGHDGVFDDRGVFAAGGFLGLGEIWGLGGGDGPIAQASAEQIDEGAGAAPLGGDEGLVGLIGGDQGLLEQAVGVGLGFLEGDFVEVGEVGAQLVPGFHGFGEGSGGGLGLVEAEFEAADAVVGLADRGGVVDALGDREDLFVGFEGGLEIGGAGLLFGS